VSRRLQTRFFFFGSLYFVSRPPLSRTRSSASSSPAHAPSRLMPPPVRSPQPLLAHTHTHGTSSHRAPDEPAPSRRQALPPATTDGLAAGGGNAILQLWICVFSIRSLRISSTPRPGQIFTHMLIRQRSKVAPLPRNMARCSPSPTAARCRWSPSSTPCSRWTPMPTSLPTPSPPPPTSS
jgi:hypothetical protein